MIKVEGLVKKYKNFSLKEASFILPEGKITALIGPNGAGKSTIIKILSGLKEADGGRLLLDDREVKDLSKTVDFGYMSQEQDIYLNIKISDVTGFVKNAYSKRWSQEKYDHYCKGVFDLRESMKIKELSTGMRAKYFLSLELAKQPDILLMDEPTSGLDPMIREEVLEILQNLTRQEGVTILFSSHITEDIEKIANRVIYIHNGSILLEDEKEEIKKRYVQIDKEKYGLLPSDLKDIVRQEGLSIQDYYVCDSRKDERLRVNTKEALLSDVLIYLKEGAKHV